MEDKKVNQEILKFDILFEKLKEAKQEQMSNMNLSESDYTGIHDSIKMLEEIQQSIDTSTYTYYTQT